MYFFLVWCLDFSDLETKRKISFERESPLRFYLLTLALLS